VTVHPFAGLDVWQLLCQRAGRSADRPFLVWQPPDGETGVWTYREFLRDASAVAAGLTCRGIRAGDPVLVHLDNGPDFLLAWFGCAAVGAVAVTTNTRSAQPELAYFADHCGAVAAVTSPAYADLVGAAAPGLSWLAVGTGELRADPDDLAAREPDPLAPMSVQYTSGTTSRPKGVLWNHANALWGARTNAAHQGLRADDVYYTYLPLFHTNALAYSMPRRYGRAGRWCWCRSGRPRGSGPTRCAGAAPGRRWSGSPRRRSPARRARRNTRTGCGGRRCPACPPTTSSASAPSAGGG